MPRLFRGLEIAQTCDEERFLWLPLPVRIIHGKFQGILECVKLDVYEVSNFCGCLSGECMQRERGFSLLELMIAVAIAGILASVALPSYTSYVIRSKLVDMTDGIAAMSANMEIYFQDNRTYADSGSFTSPCQAVTSTNYSIACTSNATTYTLTATGVGSISDFVFTLNQAGNRGTTSVKTGWGTVPASCWHVEPGGSC